MRNIYLLLSLLVICCSAVAQPSGFAQRPQLKVKSYNIGYRIFEIDGFGNNVFTMAPLLKNPQPFNDYINALDWNSMHGNPGINVPKMLNVSVTFYKPSLESRFWRKYTVQAGLFISNKMKKDGMDVGNEKWNWADSTKHFDFYRSTNELQLTGANIGLNRSSRLWKKLNFSAGFQLQGSVAVHHIYKQQWDSSVFHLPTSVWIKSSSTAGPDLEAKNYFQWQALVPFGLEMNVYKQKLAVRLEAILGMIGGRYQSLYDASWESHGAGLWLIYKPG